MSILILAYSAGIIVPLSDDRAAALQLNGHLGVDHSGLNTVTRGSAGHKAYRTIKMVCGEFRLYHLVQALLLRAGNAASRDSVLEKERRRVILPSRRLKRNDIPLAELGRVWSPEPSVWRLDSPELSGLLETLPSLGCGKRV